MKCSHPFLHGDTHKDIRMYKISINRLKSMGFPESSPYNILICTAPNRSDFKSLVQAACIRPSRTHAKCQTWVTQDNGTGRYHKKTGQYQSIRSCLKLTELTWSAECEYYRDNRMGVLYLRKPTKLVLSCIELTHQSFSHMKLMNECCKGTQDGVKLIRKPDLVSPILHSTSRTHINFQLWEIDGTAPNKKTDTVNSTL